MDVKKSHDKAYVLVQARQLLFPKKNRKLKEKVKKLAIEKKGKLQPF